MKRQNYIGWDEYFMGIAMLSAQRSKDNSTQVGACIVNNEKKIVAVGYNGMPTGCCDDDMPWERKADSPLSTKYPFVCHNKYADTDGVRASQMMFRMCGVITEKYSMSGKELILNL